MRRFLAGPAAAVLLLSACTVTTAGRPTASSEPVHISEAGADWAVHAVDPCRLLGSPALTAMAIRSPYPLRPHECRLDIRLPGGRTDHVQAMVGEQFGSYDRAEAIPTSVGGLSAYQRRELTEPVYKVPHCRVDIPLSRTRSVQVEASASSPDDGPGCATARLVAESAAGALGRPSELVGVLAPTAVRAWTACDLVAAATAFVSSDGPLTEVDKCLAHDPAAGDAGPLALSVEITAGGDPADQPGVTPVRLSFGTATEFDDDTSCRIAVAIAPIAGAGPRLPVQRLEVVQPANVDPCPAARATTEAIHAALLRGAPPRAPTPAHLGFPDGTPDDEVPAVCGAYNVRDPLACRVPRPVTPPRDAREALAAASGPDAADSACTVLRDAVDAAAVLGRDLQFAAAFNGSCVALSGPDGVLVELGFYRPQAADGYCTPPDLDRQAVTVGGRRGWECAASGQSYSLILPALGADPAVPGVILVDGKLLGTRGQISYDLIDDAPTIRRRTEAVAAAVIQRLS